MSVVPLDVSYDASSALLTPKYSRRNQDVRLSSMYQNMATKFTSTKTLYIVAVPRSIPPCIYLLYLYVVSHSAVLHILTYMMILLHNERFPILLKEEEVSVDMIEEGPCCHTHTTFTPRIPWVHYTTSWVISVISSALLFIAIYFSSNIFKLNFQLKVLKSFPAWYPAACGSWIKSHVYDRIWGKIDFYIRLMLLDKSNYLKKVRIRISIL